MTAFTLMGLGWMFAGLRCWCLPVLMWRLKERTILSSSSSYFSWRAGLSEWGLASSTSLSHLTTFSSCSSFFPWSSSPRTGHPSLHYWGSVPSSSSGVLPCLVSTFITHTVSGGTIRFGCFTGVSYLPAVLGSHLATGAKGQGSKASCWRGDACCGALGWLTPFSLPSVCDGLPL